MKRNLSEFGAVEYSVAAEYAKALVHLRHQKDLNRFGLVFGAGFSEPLKFPLWSTLIDRIAKHSSVSGSALLKDAKNKTSLSQLLYEHYRTRPAATRSAKLNENLVRRQWIELVRKCLYQSAPKSPKELEKKHPYLWALVPLIKATQLTVNYNFDDTIERVLEARREPTERDISRGFTTIWDSNVLNVPRQAVIYHPNGYLPGSRADKGSDQVVFLEDSFADQLLDSVTGHYTALMAHYEQSTCLFLGLSLEDPTLRHLLRKNAHVRPGHFHYFVHWVENKAGLTSEYREAVIAANFRTYNLATLFLTNDEIAAFAKLLQAPSDEFRSILREQGHDDSLVYYVTGCVSVGKTTLIDQLRGFIGHGEWTEQVLPEMLKDPKTLTKAQTKRVDEWVALQYRKKNDRLHSLPPGIYVIDRAFLDAFAFTAKRGWGTRARFNRKQLNPRDAKFPHKLRGGHVILLSGEPAEMSLRARSLGKKFDTKASKRQQDVLEEVYLKIVKRGVTRIDVRGLSIVEVVKRAARIILLGSYIEADLDAGLAKLEKL